jgi:hypothetical protein
MKTKNKIKIRQKQQQHENKTMGDRLEERKMKVYGTNKAC